MTRGARREVRGAVCDAGTRGDDRKLEIARRLLSTAARSTRARVGRITGSRRSPSRNAPRVSRRAPRSHGSLREVLEPRELVQERELDAADRAVAVLADDDLRDALVLGLRLVLVVDLGAVDEHDEVGVLLERAGLSKVGQLRA